MGAGVEAKTISRATDRLADLRVRGSAAQAAYFGTRAEIMQKTEDVFGEPDLGITKDSPRHGQRCPPSLCSRRNNAARYQVAVGLAGRGIACQSGAHAASTS